MYQQAAQYGNCTMCALIFVGVNVRSFCDLQKFCLQNLDINGYAWSNGQWLLQTQQLTAAVGQGREGRGRGRGDSGRVNSNRKGDGLTARSEEQIHIV